MRSFQIIEKYLWTNQNLLNINMETNDMYYFHNIFFFGGGDFNVNTI